MDKLIYDEDCVFADPFVSFRGRDRFVDNLQNLGSFITKYSANMLDYTQDENTVKTRVMVKLELNLPWKPVLAWPWGVTYDIDPETFLVTNHEEAWDIEPLQVRCSSSVLSQYRVFNSLVVSFSRLTYVIIPLLIGSEANLSKANDSNQRLINDEACNDINDSRPNVVKLTFKNSY